MAGQERQVRRWNGWGDDSIKLALNAEALAFLQQRIGQSRPFQDATLAEACRGIAPSRLQAHRLIDTAAETRLRCWLTLKAAAQQSLPTAAAPASPASSPRAPATSRCSPSTCRG